MAKFVAFHSFKGGTGKSTLAANFAALSAMQQKNVCLLDFDFRAPSLHVFFKEKPNLWLNDFLNGKCQIVEALHEIDMNDAGNLSIGFANPSMEAMRDMMTKDREWEARALHQILSSKAVMQEEGFDLVVFDTSPGVQYSSVNALASSNAIVLVMNKDELDREGTANIVNKLYKPLGRRMGIVLNKVLFCLPGERSENMKEPERESRQLTESVENELGCPVWGLIPCFCEVLLEGPTVHALQKPDHPFVTKLSTVTDNIVRNF